MLCASCGEHQGISFKSMIEHAFLVTKVAFYRHGSTWLALGTMQGHYTLSISAELGDTSHCISQGQMLYFSKILTHFLLVLHQVVVSLHH